MSPRTMKPLVKFAAAASALSAVALTASAIPASAAAPVAYFYGSGYNQEIECVPPTTHGLESGAARGFTAVSNGCVGRLWLHQFSDGSGWSYCVGPHQFRYLPTWAEFPAQALVSKNTATC
jgi:hypothetical protein